MNDINIVGNIVSDPMSIANGKGWKLRIANNEKVGDKEVTVFINIKLFGYVAKDVEFYQLKKGDKVYVKGRLALEAFESQTGEKEEYAIHANSVMKIEKPKREKKLDVSF